MIYEIKSGDQEGKLINQIYERGFFIYKYIQSIFDKPIAFIGFFRRNSNYSSNNDTKENQGNGKRNMINNTQNNYILLDNFPFIIYTFEIQDSIFGEKLKYEKEELNAINNVNQKINNVNQKINNLEEKVTTLDLKIKLNTQILNEIYDGGMNSNQKISSIENRISALEHKLDEVLKKIS